MAEALDGLPPEFGELLDNVAVVVEDEPDPEVLEELGMDPDEGDELLGLYEGTPLDARGVDYGALPDRIMIYRGPILRIAHTRRDIIQQVQETVLHELGHHFGLGEEDLPF